MKLPIVIIENQSHGKGARTALIKTQKINIVPQVSCEGAKSYVSLRLYVPGLDGYSSYSLDQRYAVKVGNDVFNADHSRTLIGEKFTLDGRDFYIPPSSEGLIFIYVDNNVDRTPVRVTLIPGPDQEYNGIYEVDGYDGGLTEVDYVNKDTAMSFCLKPNEPMRVLSCVGATDVLVLDYVNKTQQEGGNYSANEGISYRLLVNRYTYFDMNFAYGVENKYPIGENEGEYLKGIINDDGTLTISVHSKTPIGKECTLKITSYGSSPSPDYVIIDESSNPTAFYNSDEYAIMACLTYTEIPAVVLDCTGADSYFSASLKEVDTGGGYNTNHTTARYTVIMNGVDYGEWDVGSSESFYCDDVTLDPIVDSNGSCQIYAYTANGSEVANKFEFVSRSDMVDANFWGINIESNPTLIYDPVKRNISVCMTSSANT